MEQNKKIIHSIIRQEVKKIFDVPKAISPIDKIKEYLQEYVGDISDPNKFFPVHEVKMSSQENIDALNDEYGGEMICVYRSGGGNGKENEVNTVSRPEFKLHGMPPHFNMANTQKGIDYQNEEFLVKMTYTLKGEGEAIRELYANRNDINKWIDLWITMIFIETSFDRKIWSYEAGRQFLEMHKINHVFGYRYRNLIPLRSIEEALPIAGFNDGRDITNLNQLCKFFAAIIYLSLKEHPFFVIKFTS